MKKIIRDFLSVFLFTAMIIPFASCAGSASESKKESEPEKEAEKIENELAGKEFCEDDDFSLSFTEDLYIAKDRSSIRGTFYIYKNNQQEYLIDTTDIYQYEINSYSYTLNHEKGFIILKPVSSITEYYKDGKKLYTEPETIPETFEKFKEEKIKFYKALKPDFDENMAADLYWDDMWPLVTTKSDLDTITKESYAEWRTYKIKQRESYNEFYSFLPYKLEGSKLILADDDVAYLPEGTKFGDIFKTRYGLFYSSPEKVTDKYGYSRTKFQMRFCHNTLNMEDPFITIYSDDGTTSKGYVILDGTNESMTIAEQIDYKMGQAVYNPADIQICPITYTEGENKVTATVTIEGKNYSFEIKYPTAEEVAAWLEEDSEVLTEK